MKDKQAPALLPCYKAGAYIILCNYSAFRLKNMKSFSKQPGLQELAKLELPIILFAILATNALAFIQANRHNLIYHFDLMDSPTLAGLIAGIAISTLARILQEKNARHESYSLLLVESLATALDERDKYTFGHARRVTNLALQLADYLNDKKIDRELLRLSCILHDIGKIGISDVVLLKPGKLTQDEFTEIKKHPDRGARILNPAAGNDKRIDAISKIIRHHHERFDGKGYPSGLSGEEIPLLSRVIALADSFDAMTSNRPYRKGMAYEDALAIVTENSGSQFDPILAPKFVELLKKCRAEGACKNRNDCTVFAKISNLQIAKAYKSQYCNNNYRACARYKEFNNAKRLSRLLPDGSLLLHSSSKNLSHVLN